MSTLFLWGVIVLSITARMASAHSAGLNVVQVTESKEGPAATTIRIGLSDEAAFPGQTSVEVKYPGSIARRMLPDGSIKVDQFANKDHSIIGFNFKGGVEINDIYIVILTSYGIAVVDNVCDQLVNRLGITGHLVRAGDLYLNAIEDGLLTISHHNSGSDQGWFDFKATISNGEIRIIGGPLRNL